MSMSFDEPNLLPQAGLVALAELAQRLGLPELIAERLDLGAAAGQPNRDIKAMTVIGGLLAGADSIDDLDVMRAGATAEIFAVRAPSTLGTFLRGFGLGQVRQLDAVSRELLVRCWRAGAGPAPGADVFVDVDSTVCEVFGLAKQGASRGYTGQRGYHPLLATCAGDGVGGGGRQLIHSRLREGRAVSGRGAGSFIAETLARLAAALPSHETLGQGRVTVRADSGFDARKVIRACRRAGAQFSITVRLNPSLRAAIAAIPDDAWVPIPYWSSTGLHGQHPDGSPVSGADVAEVPYTAFAGTRDAVEVRLIVRRVRPTPETQLALFCEFSYHAFITDRAGATLTLEAEHRDHAVVEQVIGDLKGSCGLAHLPSGSFAANAAWLALVGIAYQLARTAAALTGPDWQRSTVATLRTRLLALPGRVVHTARRLHLRLPANWPWAGDLHSLRDQLTMLASG